jgi:hypothetical protein
VPKVIYDLSFVNAWGKKRFFKRPTVSFSFFIYYRIRYVAMSPFFDGEGYGLNGDVGSWISGYRCREGQVICLTITQPGGFLLPGFFPLTPGPATLPTLYHIN